jgi:hypothetical protein
MALASQAEVNWLIAVLAASPASFQPSKAAISAGEVSLPTASSSIASHLPSSCRDQDRLAAGLDRVSYPKPMF